MATLEHVGRKMNNVGRKMLRAFDHSVRTRQSELKIELVHVPWRYIIARTWPNDYNNMHHKCCMKKLTSFKFEPTTPKMSQQGG